MNSQPRLESPQSPHGLQAVLLSSHCIEQAIAFGLICGTVCLALHAVCGRCACRAGGRLGDLFVEIQRKSFHIIGGCILSAVYHFGLKYGYLRSAYLPEAESSLHSLDAKNRAMDAGTMFLALCFVSWLLEAIRLLSPAVQQWYLKSMHGLLREKEHRKAAGVAYFLPGALAAMLAAPSHLAILGILFLSLGDAASSLGTAVGRINVGSSSRKMEGSAACFLVCSCLGIYCGLQTSVAVVASSLVSSGELLAEVIGLDDNLLLPLLGVLGVRIALCPEVYGIAITMAMGLAVGLSLGMVVALTSCKHD
eukprot:TRINITY_DN37834_c0_g1_i1.p1 TRINITY_DN37834_c0_g1~~TRINITY_DN37834_c0_g1_i1.p1  ORF type:complete len:308 (-),score=40.87 TRINITY_DN37834_c0_g1_i1:22-945(-)